MTDDNWVERIYELPLLHYPRIVIRAYCSVCKDGNGWSSSATGASTRSTAAKAAMKSTAWR